MPEHAHRSGEGEAIAGVQNQSRRGFIEKGCTLAIGGWALAHESLRADIVRTDLSTLPPYGNSTIGPGIRSRVVSNVNGLNVHLLEAGFETPGRPAVLLLHGFPELAYSWRKVMRPLAEAGYHVIAPDQRGYGRTTGWDDSYDADPDAFRILNMTRDAIGLIYALGYRSVAMVVGHDAGAPSKARRRCLSTPPMAPHHLARLQPMTNSTRSSRRSTRRGSTTRTISGRLEPMPTCCMRRKACTPSSAPTISTRAPTTQGTNRIP
jgi:hypothetical protein